MNSVFKNVSFFKGIFPQDSECDAELIIIVLGRMHACVLYTFDMTEALFVKRRNLVRSQEPFKCQILKDYRRTMRNTYMRCSGEACNCPRLTHRRCGMGAHIKRQNTSEQSASLLAMWNRWWQNLMSCLRRNRSALVSKMSYRDDRMFPKNVSSCQRWLSRNISSGLSLNLSSISSEILAIYSITF